jgi:hypothetical protein
MLKSSSLKLSNLKLACLAAAALISSCSAALAQTPTDAPAEKAKPAPLVSADEVPLRPSNAAVATARQQPPQPEGRRAVVLAAKQPAAPAKTAHVPANAARFASLALPNRPHAGPSAGGADATAAVMRSTKLANLPSAAARPVSASGFVALPTNAAPALRARSPSAQRKAMRNLPKSALARQKAKSGRRPG